VDASDVDVANTDGLTLLELLEVRGISLADVSLSAEVERRLGLTITEATREGVTITMPVGPAAFNGSGNVHGGAIATLVDVSAGLAATIGSGYRPNLDAIVTADLHVRYLGRAKGTMLVARSHVLRAGKQLVVVECTVRDELDNMVAVADFSSMIVPPRGPLPGNVGGAAAPDL
jgi:uncharacterized protein (TIGR00369 family)